MYTTPHQPRRNLSKILSPEECARFEEMVRGFTTAPNTDFHTIHEAMQSFLSSLSENTRSGLQKILTNAESDGSAVIKRIEDLTKEEYESFYLDIPDLNAYIEHVYRSSGYVLCIGGEQNFPYLFLEAFDPKFQANMDRHQQKADLFHLADMVSAIEQLKTDDALKDSAKNLVGDFSRRTKCTALSFVFNGRLPIPSATERFAASAMQMDLLSDFRALLTQAKAISESTEPLTAQQVREFEQSVDTLLARIKASDEQIADLGHARGLPTHDEPSIFNKIGSAILSFFIWIAGFFGYKPKREQPQQPDDSANHLSQNFETKGSLAHSDLKRSSAIIHHKTPPAPDSAAQMTASSLSEPDPGKHRRDLP